MKQEKHVWRTEKLYLQILGDSENHYVIKRKRCEKCGAVKQCK